MTLTLEKFVDGTWWPTATLTIDEPRRGIASPCTVEYLPEYALEYLGASGRPALSVHMPVSFHHGRYLRWAPFLLDILPSGFGRDVLFTHKHWAPPDGPRYDTAVLTCGASHPAGNVRCAEAQAWLQAQLSPAAVGWSLDEMGRHASDFLEYARAHGTLVAGTSTQGQAAKLWLTQHRDGLYYVDTQVPDTDARAHYLMKIPRHEKEAILLRHEFQWLQLAKVAGLEVHGGPFLSGDLLFIPRFDRTHVAGGVERRAMESAFSLMGVAAHGAPLQHEDILEAWVPLADLSALGADLLEYLRRDILGYCLRVEDNHGRNTAFFLTEAGLKLTPLFDFSPMFLGDDPPVRSTLWRQFTPGSHTEWARLFDHWLPGLLGQGNCEALRQALVAWLPRLEATCQQFRSLARDPRTALCEQRFRAAREALDALG